MACVGQRTAKDCPSCSGRVQQLELQKTRSTVRLRKNGERNGMGKGYRLHRASSQYSGARTGYRDQEGLGREEVPQGRARYDRL
jgi:hypothetical protein